MKDELLKGNCKECHVHTTLLKKVEKLQTIIEIKRSQKLLITMTHFSRSSRKKK